MKITKHDYHPGTTAAAMTERTFTVRTEHIDSLTSHPPEFTLSEMLTANDEDPSFVSWLITARVGDEYTNGGGAAPLFTTRRIT